MAVVQEETPSRWFCPSCLGLSFVLAVVRFLTRMSNPYLQTFENLGLSRPFIGSIFYAAGGAAIGTGLALALTAWNFRYSLLKTPSVLLHTAFSFLTMSLLWTAAIWIEDAALLCAVFCLFMICGSILYLASCHRDKKTRNLCTGTAPCSSDTMRKGSLKKAASFLWVSFLGAALAPSRIS